MGRLRIYTSVGCAETLPSDEMFYVRRGSGPYYRWRYETEAARWCYSRVHPVASMLKGLRNTTLRETPFALQMKLREHYQR
ncbi:MAG TPA: hypothetical protein VFX96_17520 [Pyrinomonadaceae bacterium]|nr:hypothetical protein [Pyrinomonadaceae bacterium]